MGLVLITGGKLFINQNSELVNDMTAVNCSYIDVVKMKWEINQNAKKGIEVI